METEVTVWELIIVLGIAQGLFFSVLLFTHKKGNKTANRLLSLLLFAFTIRLIEIVAYWTKYLHEFPQIWTSSAYMTYAIAPLFYFYTIAVLEQNSIISRKQLLHFVPFILLILIQSPFYFMDAEFKRGLIETYVYGEATYTGSRLTFNRIIYYLQFPFLITYVIQSVRKFKQFKIDMNGSREYDKSRLRWLSGLMIGFISTLFLWLTYNLSLLFGVEYLKLIDYSVTYSMTIFIYMTGIFAFRNPEIIYNATPKYQKSSLNADSVESYAHQLIDVMKSKKPYLNPQLKLSELAEILNISVHHLSQVLNNHFNQNFFDFINAYRVVEAQTELKKSAHQFTIESIAYTVGFNNRSSFNTAFKKITGQTPKQFISSQ